ncbi:MAG: SRPBCC family protein [Alphaproteobacteria bacterium GM202ARS2]|nr:SRPBCC family protein [Alphaproteobacteria bacterium GM202ARS2]
MSAFMRFFVAPVFLATLLFSAHTLHAASLNVTRDVVVNETPEEVWRVIGTYSDMSWHPAVHSTQMSGARTPTRMLILGDGSIVREELIDNVDGQSFTYKILSGPLPVVNYVSTVSVESVGRNKSRVTWTSTFDPPPNVSKSDSQKAIIGVYEAGLDNLKKMFR